MQYYKTKAQSNRNSYAFISQDRIPIEKKQNMIIVGMDTINPMCTDTVVQDNLKQLMNSRNYLMSKIYEPELQSYDYKVLN